MILVLMNTFNTVTLLLSLKGTAPSLLFSLFPSLQAPLEKGSRYTPLREHLCFLALLNIFFYNLFFALVHCWASALKKLIWCLLVSSSDRSVGSGEAGGLSPAAGAGCGRGAAQQAGHRPPVQRRATGTLAGQSPAS